MNKLTKLTQLSDRVREHSLGVDYYSHAMYFGTTNPYFAQLSQEGATYLAHSCGIQITFAKGTIGYAEEQAAIEEERLSATTTLDGKER